MDESPLQRQLATLAARAQREDQQRRIDTTVSILAALYDKAATYTTLVIAAGFAGFFAVWVNVRDELSRTELLFSGLFISFALAVFVFWEVAVMLYTSRTLRHLQNALKAPPETFDTVMEQTQKESDRETLRIRKFWFVILILTIVPGVIGAGVLMVAFIRALLHDA
jgi:hypothetical protein